MRNFKTIIALLLSIVMIFSLVACGAGDDKDDKNGKKDKEKTEQTDSDKDDDKDTSENEDKETEETEESDKKPGKEESKKEDLDDYSVAQLIVGKWEAKVDFTETLLSIIGDDEAAEYFDFDTMYFYIDMSFTKDGEVTVSASAEELIEIFIDGIVEGFPDYAESLGMTMDEVYDELDTDEEHFAEDFVASMDLDSLSTTETGEYTIDGNEIVVDGEGLEVEFKDVNTFVVSGDDFDLGNGEDVKFERKGKFNPPDADEVEDNVVSGNDDKPSKDEEVSSDDPEDLIVGEWEAKIDITETIAISFAASLDDVGAMDYFDFDPMYLYINLEFKKNGDMVLGMDAEDFVDTFIEGIEDGIKEYAAANGVDMEEIYDELDTDEDHFAEDFVAMIGYDSLSGEMEAEYEIDGDEIVVEGDGLEFEFDDEDTLLLDTVGLGLDYFVSDDMIEFVRQ